jgi:hypothetical protein
MPRALAKGTGAVDAVLWLQVLALEAALESQRLDTEQRIAAASKVAEQTALHSPATPPHGRIPAPGALPPADGSPSTLDRFAGSFLNRGASLWQGSAPSPTTARPGTGVLAYGGAQVPGGSPYETELDRRAQEMQRKQQVLVAQQRNENQDTLVMSISQPLGFDRGRPVAAVLIFRCGLIFFLHSTVLCFAWVSGSEEQLPLECIRPSLLRTNCRLNAAPQSHSYAVLLFLVTGKNSTCKLL